MKRIIGLALVVLAIAGTVNVIHKFAAGDTTQPTGNAAYDSGRKAGKYTAPVVLAVVGLMGLWLLFQSDDMRPTSPPPRRTPSPVMPPPGDPSLRGGQNTFASNPARLQLNIGTWLAANPVVVIMVACMALAGVVLLFIKLVAGVVLIVTAGITVSSAIKTAKQKFFMGDVCAGVVLSAKDDLVAVFTDLKAGDNLPRPAIKILKQPLRRITTEPAYDGMRIAAAALYHGNVQQAAWQNFSPEVINCVVRDPEEITRVLASITEQEWQTLDHCLAQIPVAKPGLYRLWGDVPNVPDLAPAKLWFKTTPGVIGLSVAGAIIALFIGLQVLAAVARSRNHPTIPSQPINPTAPSVSANMPKPGQPTSTETFAVGDKVEANWAGGWLPGKITKVNPGGFSMMVQLEDSRFPNPIVLSARQLRK